MTVETAEAVIKHIEKFNITLREMVVFLTEKQAKVMADDLIWLTDSIDREQALVMKISSEEKSRLELFSELSLDGVKMKEIIEDAPEERKQKLSAVSSEMTGYITDIQRLNAEIVETVEKKLAVQREIVQKTGMQSTTTYNGYGAMIKKTNGNKSFLGNI